MGNALDWMNPVRWQGPVLVLAALIVGYLFWESHIEQRGYDKAVAKYAKQAQEADAKRETVATPIVEAHEKEVVRVVTVTKTILKDRPVYVKDTDCPLTGGFRVLHDAAANGEVPDPSAIPDAAPTPAAAVADTVATNYGICLKIRADLISLQSWAEAQASLKR